MIKFYGYKKCGTCRKAMGILTALNREFEFIDITLSPPDQGELLQFLSKGELELKKLFNTSGELYREMKLKDRLPSMAQAKLIDLLAKHGKLIKRPLVTDGRTFTVGLAENEFKQAWASGSP